MEAEKLKKKYLTPQSELVRLSATDVLKASDNPPGEDVDENQGVWIG